MALYVFHYTIHQLGHGSADTVRRLFKAELARRGFVKQVEDHGRTATLLETTVAITSVLPDGPTKAIAAFDAAWKTATTLHPTVATIEYAALEATVVKIKERSLVPEGGPTRVQRLLKSIP